MLGSDGMDALNRLSKSRGALDQSAVHELRNMLKALAALPDGTPAVAEHLVSALLLAGAEEQRAADLLTLAAACEGDRQCVDHALSLLDFATQAQPAPRRGRPAKAASDYRVVGQ